MSNRFKTNFNTGAILDPTRGASDALGNVSDLMMNAEKIRQNKAAMERQKILDDRATSEYDYKVKQRKDLIDREKAKNQIMSSTIGQGLTEELSDNVRDQVIAARERKELSEIVDYDKLLSEATDEKARATILKQQADDEAKDKAFWDKQQDDKMSTLEGYFDEAGSRIVDPNAYRKNIQNRVNEYNANLGEGQVPITMAEMTAMTDTGLKQAYTAPAKVNKDLIKARLDHNNIATKNKLSALKNRFSVSKGGGGSKSYTDAPVKDQAELYAYFNKNIPNEDWHLFGWLGTDKGLGGTSLKEESSKYLKQEYVTPQILKVAAEYALEGANNALWDKDAEVVAHKYKEKIEELRKLHKDTGTYPGKGGNSLTQEQYAAKVDKITLDHAKQFETISKGFGAGSQPARTNKEYAADMMKDFMLGDKTKTDTAVIDAKKKVTSRYGGKDSVQDDALVKAFNSSEPGQIAKLQKSMTKPEFKAHMKALEVKDPTIAKNITDYMNDKRMMGDALYKQVNGKTVDNKTTTDTQLTTDSVNDIGSVYKSLTKPEYNALGRQIGTESPDFSQKELTDMVKRISINYPDISKEQAIRRAILALE